MQNHGLNETAAIYICRVEGGGGDDEAAHEHTRGGEKSMCVCV